MKHTGIIRRVDDLGRVVIPKEIRRNLNIREGDPLEIYTGADGGVTFKKYDPCDGYKARAVGMFRDMLDDGELPPEIRDEAMKKIRELVALLGADVK